MGSSKMSSTHSVGKTHWLHLQWGCGRSPQMAGAMPGWTPQTRRRDWAMACALGLAAVCCAGQEPAPTYAVRGVVVNSATHQPIARALVEVGGTPNAVLTDGEGR